jgi:SAM-dependent methyltransferase
MTISAEKVLDDACQMYRQLCEEWLANREFDWPEICRDKSEVNLAERIVILRSAEGRYLRRYHYRQDDGSIWEPEICRECQKPILDCYMAKDELWRQAGYDPLDLVCPECLEKSVGRRLVSRDFERMRRHSTKERRSLPGVGRAWACFSQVHRYTRKKVLREDRIVARIRASRHGLARKLVEPYAGQKLLDYGCGDGAFLALVQDLFPEAVAADVDPRRLSECARHLARTGLSFVLRSELSQPRHEGAYGVVACREVLEHCLEETWDDVLRDLTRVTAPGGTIVISTPIESGPSLILKEGVRTVAGWHGLGPEAYTIGQFWKMVFAGERTVIDRPVYRGEFATEKWKRMHGHKGFNWHRLRARLENRLAVERTCFWPVAWSRGYFSGQVWFICKQRPSIDKVPPASGT